MPNQAFFNLPEDRRKLIISVALDEFSSADYDTASINQICRKSNIAKGSFYQYFKDKLDLYVYTMTLAIEKKVSFFTKVLDQFAVMTLQEQIRLLFIKGIEFAEEYPQYAALGERFSIEKNTTARSAVMQEGEKQSEQLFVQMIDYAKSNGQVSSDVDTIALSMLLQSLNRAVSEYLAGEFGNADRTKHETDTIKLVDSLLNIIFNGISPVNRKSQ